MLRRPLLMVRWRRALGASIVRLSTASVAFSTPPPVPAVTYDPAPTTIVASVHEFLGEGADADPGPRIDVYGDGRIAVHRPHYMTRPGDWTDRLRPSDLETLLGSLVADGLLDLDGPRMRERVLQAARARRAAARRGENTLFEASDPGTTELTLRANGRENVIHWTGLRADAWAHPGIPEIQRLNRARARLSALADRPSLRRTP